MIFCCQEPSEEASEAEEKPAEKSGGSDSEPVQPEPVADASDDDAGDAGDAKESAADEEVAAASESGEPQRKACLVTSLGDIQQGVADKEKLIGIIYQLLYIQL